jgi:dimethylamine monooxygenase subunit C
MPDDVAYPPRTSMPVWASTPPALSTAATEYTIFSLDSADDATARAWSAGLTAAGVAHHVETVEGAVLPEWLASCGAHVERLAATRHVGWRVAAAGDEVGVLAVLAAARRVGLVDAEVTVFPETRRRAQVFCPHCKATTLADQFPGGQVACGGCARTLVVRPHVSRDTGTYLGVCEPDPV